MIQNIVSNAIKFCGQGDKITLSIPPGEATTICVHNTGPVIEPERLGKIFRSKTTSVGSAGETGTGYGLILVRDMVEFLGGEVRCHCSEGVTFSVRLPYVRPKILVVDDDHAFRQIQRQLLSVLDVDVVEAGDGREAMEMVCAHNPHLVLADAEMPIMDGFELLEKLRSAPETQGLPVIIVSGRCGMEVRHTIFNMGAQDFLEKSDLSLDTFIPRVRRFIA